MIKQPLGCILLLAGFLLWIGFVIGLGLLIIRGFGLCKTCETELIVAVLGGLGFFSLPVTVDPLHIIGIYVFCRRRGLKVLKVKIFKSHYGVDFVENGEKKYGKWPQDFEKYA